MSIVRHKSIAKDGTAHAILFGICLLCCYFYLISHIYYPLAYGGFGLCVDQGFQPDIIPCLSKYKIVFAVAYIRGGGELGEEWHNDGKGYKKVQCLLSSIYISPPLIPTFPAK